MKPDNAFEDGDRNGEALIGEFRSPSRRNGRLSATRHSTSSALGQRFDVSDLPGTDGQDCVLRSVIGWTNPRSCGEFSSSGGLRRNRANPTDRQQYGRATELFLVLYEASGKRRQSLVVQAQTVAMATSTHASDSQLQCRLRSRAYRLPSAL